MSIFGKLGFEGIESLTLGQKIALELLGSNYMGEQAAVTMAGELYLNFGYVGLVIFSTLIGFLMQYLYVFTLRNSNKPLKSIFLAYFQVAMIMILGGPVFSMALDYVIFMFIFYLFWRIIYSSIYLTKRRN
jgi:oligosaccharide repeat unit polymerase